MRNKLTLEEVKSALNESNGDLTHASNILKINYLSLYYFVKKNNIKFKLNKKRLCSKEKIQEAYIRLGSLFLVAKELGGTKEGI